MTSIKRPNPAISGTSFMVILHSLRPHPSHMPTRTWNLFKIPSSLLANTEYFSWQPNGRAVTTEVAVLIYATLLYRLKGNHGQTASNVFGWNNIYVFGWIKGIKVLLIVKQNLDEDHRNLLTIYLKDLFFILVLLAGPIVWNVGEVRSRRESELNKT